MATLLSQLDLIEVFRELSAIPLREGDQAGALSAIAHLGKKVLNSQVCTITLVDLQVKLLHQAACAGNDAEFEKRWVGKDIPIGSLEDGSYVDYDLIA